MHSLVMLARLWCAAMMLLVGAPVAAAPAPGPRIVAIGDLHGDFAAWRSIASDARLIDARGRWTGGRATLVQTGDVVDRGPDSLGILRDLMRLQREANRAGGRVIALVGNHEAMNVTGDLRYVPTSDFAAFATAASPRLRERVYARNAAAIEAAYRRGDPAITPSAARQRWLAATPLGMLERQAAWQPNGSIGRWIVRNPAVVMLEGTLFVHGGLSVEYAKLPLDEINRRVAASLTTRETGPEAIINDPLGPLWYRGLATREASEQEPPAATRPPIEEELAAVLGAYGAQRIVFGHTPVLSGIALLHGGRLARIDTGISAHYGGKLSWLEIVDGQMVAHEVEQTGP